MAKKKTPDMPDRLEQIEGRLLRLEKLVHEDTRLECRETAIEPWQFLVRRAHPWRKQLYVKGRNLTARQLVGAMKSNHWDDAKAAENYHLPIQAIGEALDYVEKNLNLLTTETEIERLMRKREGGRLIP